MKKPGHSTFFLYVLLLFTFILTACQSENTFKVSNDYIAANKEQWLAKAYRVDKNGWIFLHIEGKPFERGFQRGYLTADEIEKYYNTISYLNEFETGRDIDFFIKASSKLFKNKVSSEYIKEMQGMVAGMREAGKEVTYDQMLFMNGYIDITWYWWPENKELMTPGCSALIASGDATSDGSIVMAHNSWAAYADLQFCNIIVDISPEKGNRILMQSIGPSIYSATDFFITSAGLIGTETTIGGFHGFNPKGTPVFERARRAMQYANSIDEWTQTMIENNSGAYANSWLIGDINTGQIAKLELGLKYHNIEKKTNGYFIGSNIAEDIKILRIETNAKDYDIRNKAVARRVRWEQLMKENYGGINTENAKTMLGDHYDAYLKKENPSSRTICGHYELENGAIPTSGTPYFPAGAIDGKVVDSSMAGDWKFWAKWGSSCDRDFNADEFLKEHPQYKWLEGYLPNLPPQPWTIMPVKQSD